MDILREGYNVMPMGGIGCGCGCGGGGGIGCGCGCGCSSDRPSEQVKSN